VFRESARDKMPTTDILAALNKMDESPWATIRRGEPLDARGLSYRLGKYGIGPKPQRVGDGPDDVFKGYSAAQFEDAWSRYLDDAPLGPDFAVTAVTSASDLFSESESATGVTDVTDSVEPDPDPRRPGCVCAGQPEPCHWCAVAAAKKQNAR
jgi:hypothetical protein